MSLLDMFSQIEKIELMKKYEEKREEIVKHLRKLNKTDVNPDKFELYLTKYADLKTDLFDIGQKQLSLPAEAVNQDLKHILLKVTKDDRKIFHAFGTKQGK